MLVWRHPLPDDAKKCIASWRRFFPDYEIREWNERNVDVSICKYTAQAYEAKKYAFVSDYVRFYAMNVYGGVYFDTDVEVVAPMDDIIAAGPFMGIEKSTATNGLSQGGEVGVATGLGMAALPGMKFHKTVLDYYDNLSFDINDGTVVKHTTELLKKFGFKNANVMQKVAGITIYPDEYFCPMDSTTGIITMTPRTVAIHHYACSWMDHGDFSFRMHMLKNKLISIFGPKVVMKVAAMIKR